MNKALQNYECEGQLSIFDLMLNYEENHNSTPAEEYDNETFQIGNWVQEHGPRVFFDDIKENKCYIADYSTVSHKWYKVVYVKWLKNDSVGYVDSPKGVTRNWSFGNNFSALTRKDCINSDYNGSVGEADTNGWWYELPSEKSELNTTDDYIKENPTCFYVFGHYLDKEQGWHKVPDELPTFTEWTLIDVVIFGKKTGTAWMEHGKWEAKDWTFRSVDQRRTSEDTEILAWKASD